MQVRVLFFARGRELAGVSESDVEVGPGATVHQLWLKLLEDYPDLSEIAGCTVLALNQTYVNKDDPVVLKDGDEVALIPPISGG
eukprot:jgi/Botrbrau1/2952/Bobra.0026s0023.1